MSAVVALLERRGVLTGFRREGGRLFGPCPVHGGDNVRAFVVDLAGDRWYCFTRCRRGGGPKGLARALDLAPPDGVPAPTQVAPFAPYTRSLRLDPRCDWLAAKGIRPPIAAAREVGRWHGTGMLAGCVAVRLHDPEGGPLGYAGRRLDPADVARRGKWTFPRGLPKSSLLYGLHHVQGRRVVITECPWGVLRLAQLGVDAVALLGVAMSPDQTALLARFDQLLVLLDGDPAGRAAAAHIVRSMPTARIATLPEGADPDDLTDDLLRALATARAPPAPVTVRADPH